VILDGTLLSIDRVGMASGYDRRFFSGEHKRHGVNVQVIADPAGRLAWASPLIHRPGSDRSQLFFGVVAVGGGRGGAAGLSGFSTDDLRSARSGRWSGGGGEGVVQGPAE